MFRNAVQQEEAVQAARMENAKKQTVEAVYAKYPTIVRCEANERQILSLVLAWAQNPQALPTFELFQSMLEENPEAMESLATQPLERIRQQIAEEILSLLAAHSRRDALMLKSEEARMKSWSLDALRIRLAELKTKIGMVSTPVAALKSFVRDSRPDYSQWPELPKTIWTGVAYIPLNAAYIKSLPAFEIRRLQRIYGPQVDQRLRGKI